VTEPSPNIGTLREKHLHATLKRRYHAPGTDVEVRVDGFVIDLVRGDLLIEIQTRGFSSMKRKIAALLAAGHRIRIVHPIADRRWIVKVDADGAVISRRRSPKRGRPIDICTELVAFPYLLASPDVEIDVVLTEEDEIRHHTPGASWRRHGWSVLERRLITVVDTIELRSPEDLVALLPSDLPTQFTTAELATAAGIARRTAQQVAYTLKRLEMIEATGKRGNAVVYRRAHG
jgi:hypothetical protein